MPNTTKTFDPTAIDERNETLQFIGNPPTWFMRFGISVICLVLVVFTAGAYFIKYPDIVTAKVTITTSNPPIRVLAKSSARVTELLVKNNAIVKQGEVLCVMENAANWKHVLALEKQLNYVRGTFKVPRTFTLEGSTSLLILILFSNFGNKRRTTRSGNRCVNTFYGFPQNFIKFSIIHSIRFC